MHKAVIANYAEEYTITYGIRLVEAAVSNIHIWHMFLHLLLQLWVLPPLVCGTLYIWKRVLGLSIKLTSMTSALSL